MDENLEEFENTDDENEMTFAEEMQAFYDERAEDREQEAAEDAKELERLRKHTGKDGEFRNLRDYKEYYGEEIQDSGVTDSSNYGPDSHEQHELDSIAYRESGGQRLAGGLTAWPDDPHGPKRQELMEEFQEWTEKEIQAKAAGDADGVDRARHFKKSIAKELRELPEPPELTHQRNLEKKNRLEALGRAHDPEAALDDWWDSDRVKQDGSTLAARSIIEGDSNILYLPSQISPGSHNMKPFHPKNVIKFDNLPPQVVEDIRRRVHFSADKSPGPVFKAAWDVLNVGGYASQGKLSPAAPKPKKSKAKKQKKKEPQPTSPLYRTTRPGMYG